MNKKLNNLLQKLKQTPGGSFFNPWYQHDPEHDLKKKSLHIRRKQLTAYLSDRLESARFLFVAEALGYQGGHFTGLAMTSERILLGHHEEQHGISPKGAFRTLTPQRTSRPEVMQDGFSEPTATIMWKALYQLGLDPFETVLWNALAWHPFDPERGVLSNRTPTDSELDAGIPALRTFFQLFPTARVIAVGRKSEHCLNKLGIEYTGVRHPANGGAPKFRNQMKEIIERG